MDDQAQQDTDAPITAFDLAEYHGDISGLLEDDAIAKIASKVKDAYERDCESRKEWLVVAEKGLKDMAQSFDGQEKNYPWQGASDIHYPLLPYAAMQFNARAYPAIIKGEEAVTIKVIGADKGVPQIGPDGQPLMQIQGIPVINSPQGPVMATGHPVPQGTPVEPLWKRKPDEKKRRADRVSQYMNITLFHRMDGWEEDTDTLIFQLSPVGCAFRKLWKDDKHNSRFVPATKLVVNNNAISLAEAPQVTEEIDGIFPHQIKRDMAKGVYRTIEIEEDEEEGARKLLEQQCYLDLDGDGVDEPYIVTIDSKSDDLYRIVPNYGVDDIKYNQDESGIEITYIEKQEYYVKYEFLPHPEGKFYNLGLAHLLDQYSEIINTIINQMIDANHAATAGGGFVGSGLRIQGRGQSSSLRYRPGEYKTVPVNANDLRNGIFERTTPQLSPVMFQLLDLILGAAQDIASVKDILSGEGSNQGQVGTTLALIEQGLQVFTAIYKRIYRSLKKEYKLLYKNISKYADDEMRSDYLELLDDLEANFDADFNVDDMDICPVSDPSSVTRQQRVARSQYLMSMIEPISGAGGDVKEVIKRALEAGDILDIDKIFPEQQPNPLQDQMTQMEIADKQAAIAEKQSKATLNEVLAQVKAADVDLDVKRLDLETGKAEAKAIADGINAAK